MLSINDLSGTESKRLWIKQEREQEKKDKKAMRKWNKLVQEILGDNKPLQPAPKQRKPKKA